MRARLVSLEGGPAVELAKDLTVVGRDDDCDVRLDHRSISKLHCLLVRTDGLLFLRDLGSTNGTKVNGQRVVRGALLPGDELSFASEKYRVEMGPSVPEAVEDLHEAQTEELAHPINLLDGLAQNPGGTGTGHDSESDVRLMEKSCKPERMKPKASFRFASGSTKSGCVAYQSRSGSAYFERRKK